MHNIPARANVRVILLDEDNRTLLLRYNSNNTTFWAVPGGGIEAGEEPATAARRELLEELGIPHVHIGELVGRRTRRDTGQHQVEQYYLARINNTDVDTTKATQPDEIAERRWWTVDELAQTTQTIYPQALGELIATVLTEGPPVQPITLS